MSVDDFMRELEAAGLARDEYLRQIGGCTDGYCIIDKPKGMHTNGGCQCARDHIKMQRFAYAHQTYKDRVARLIAAWRSGE